MWLKLHFIDPIFGTYHIISRVHRTMEQSYTNEKLNLAGTAREGIPEMNALISEIDMNDFAIIHILISFKATGYEI